MQNQSLPIYLIQVRAYKDTLCWTHVVGDSEADPALVLIARLSVTGSLSECYHSHMDRVEKHTCSHIVLLPLLLHQGEGGKQVTDHQL